jgi:allantoin racemase
MTPIVAVLNPNASEVMTAQMVVTLRAVLGSGAAVIGRTNRAGPPAIQGAADAEACLPGLFAMHEAAIREGAATVVVGCFDDTGLAELRARSHVPVLGLGESACLLGSLAAPRFAVVTTLPVSVPIIERNVRAMGLWDRCAGVHPSGVPVLELEPGTDCVVRAVAEACEAAPSAAIVLGCSGMTAIVGRLRAALPSARLIDPVHAAGSLAAGLVRVH